jgi:HSP20 family molecular chaperone IbpA
MTQVFIGSIFLGWPPGRSERPQNGYPPFDVEHLEAAGAEPERLRITIAVSGFAPEELELGLADNQLTLRGRRIGDDSQRVFLHRGIAMRAFQRTFPLGEGVEVESARLADGLLVIDLTRPAGRPARQVEIAVRV